MKDPFNESGLGRAGEERFERLRRWAGLLAAPVAFAVILALPLPGLRPEAHRLAAVIAGVMLLWITEALPLPVTALVGASACVILRVASAKAVFAPFADPLMFLFIGSFILARALFLHHLDRRLAFAVLSIRWIGARPGRILFAYGAVTAFLSAWISNTATTAMMVTIGMSILAFLFEHQRQAGQSLNPRYATGMMLMTSFAASVGGFATPIGSAPNILGLGFIRELVGVEVSFFKWCLIGVPVALLLFLYLAFYLGTFCSAGVREIPGSDTALRATREALGPWTRGQRSTVLACLVTVSLWVIPGVIALVDGESSPVYQFLITCLPEGVAAVVGAVLLFVLPGNGDSPAITWDEAVKIDWGTVLLFGGGFALGVLSFQTGLAEAAGRGLTASLPLRGEFGLLCAATVAATFVSEMTSNTASANMVVPVVIAIARSAGVDPLEPALGATFGSGLGFLLPVSTPPNAIVYGSGYVPLRQMMRYGILLDLAGVVVIVLVIRLAAPWIR